MKLRTSLQFGAMFPIVLAVVAILGLIPLRSSLDKSGAAFEGSGRLEVALSDLGAATCGFILDPGPAAADEWNEKCAAVHGVLDGFKTDHSLVHWKMDAIRVSLQLTTEKFEGLYPPVKGGGGPSRGALTADEKKTADEIMENISRMIKDAAEIANGTYVEIVSWQRDMEILATALLGVLALGMAGVTIMIGNRAIDRVDHMYKGMEAIANGSLDRQVDTSGQDEMTRLAIAFNAMGRKLRDSVEALRKESEQQKASAESLRKANVVLSDALIKLKRAQKQAINSERFIALQQMAGGIEHALNNSLAPILGLSDFLLAYPSSMDDRESLTEHLRTINSEVRKARDQILKVAEFFNPGRQVRTRQIDVNEVVQQAILMTQQVWRDAPRKKGVTIELRTSLKKVPMMEANEGEFYDSMAALIKNSVEAMPGGGTITVSTRADDEKIYVSVADDGEGMTEEVRERCLEPFFSTKGRDASGMGLTCVAGFSRRHGGTIEISGAPGSGTAVTIGLPFVVRRSSSVVSPDTFVQDGVKNLQKRILVVDDEKWVRHICTVALTADGHTVESASGGEEALAKLRNGRFDLVIVDKAMPMMSGEELVAEIHREFGGVRCIMLTGFAELMAEDGKLPDGVEAVLSKPVAFDILSSSVAKLFRRHA